MGWASIQFVVPDATARDQLSASLARDKVPSDFSIEVLAEANDGAVCLDAAGIYLKPTLESCTDAGTRTGTGSEPQADFVLASPQDAGKATKFLFAQIRKSIVLDGVIAYYVMRPLARVFTRAVLNTSLTPNQATLMALGCGIGAAISAGIGGASLAIVAGFLYWFGGVLDCIDGELARMRLQSSKIGEWLDSMVDEFSTIALICGMGIGLSRDGYGSHWMLLGIGGAVVAVLTLAPLYRDLHRQGLPIDTAQFPWFFDDKSEEDSNTEKSLVAKIILLFGYFIRRDANLTAIAILLMLNLRSLALAIMIVAFVAVGFLTVMHYIVMAGRSRSASS